MSRRRGAILSCAVLAGLAISLLGSRQGDGAAQGSVVFHFSRYEPVLLTARAGQPFTIRLRNEDPIEHEWIVGTEAMHARHRTGTEPYHDEVPTEVTVPALSARTTTVMFTEPGDYAFICHLPGHEAYGMRGTLRVLPSD
jgi:uncharacterized cupredoxin-like copper-binding protein